MHKKILMAAFFLFNIFILYSFPDLTGKIFFELHDEIISMSSNTLKFTDNNKYRIEYGINDGNEQGAYIFGKDDSGEYMEFNYSEYSAAGLAKSNLKKKSYFVYNNEIIIFYDSKNIINIFYLNKYDYHIPKYEVSATSTLVEYKDKPLLYSPSNFINYKNLLNFWAEGVEGSGEEQSLTFTIDKETLPLYNVKPLGLIIFNGVFRSKDLYNKNGRIKKAVIQINSSNESIEIEDTMKPQIIMLKNTNEAYIVKFLIKEIYPGTEWKDTCITKIILFGNVEGAQF